MNVRFFCFVKNINLGITKISGKRVVIDGQNTVKGIGAHDGSGKARKEREALGRI